MAAELHAPGVLYAGPFFHLSRNLFQLFVPSIEVAVHSFQLSIESFFTKSIYISLRELARPKFFYLGDEAIALGDCLALLPYKSTKT